MKMNYWAVALENIGITICFTVLAIYFNHWWIGLFSVIGWTSLSSLSTKFYK